MKFTYLAIDISAIIVPLIASFHPRIRYYQQWGMAFTSLLISGLLFIIWDIYFTHAGVWGFNQDYLLGMQLFNLPVEEILFFLCIPYACMFSYHCLLTLWPHASVPRQAANYISWLLISGGLITAIAFYNNSYTCATFLLLVLFILYVRKKSWTGQFYLCYGIMLLPFVIINGILTGSWIAAPIVWYNSNEIIGLRLLTIPIEDVFYGLILIGSQVALYEGFQKNRRIAPLTPI
ncbi:lycopene cyclase domain-containing protein [Chitinophaga sancti]|uniref:Lycopene cyclase domain-containing protein n=1 Tax=Chitinophaga sancti TaxID=1004 RepID=A0A1K1SHA4_9BACT|nr:lycopene cyclase domain-containing protein [Chitinophaga sancti]WQD59884.1 lycopene cyclase domain-containing protein [Chitinophaga sancti]WQG87985.1 lycopene cyclase domain-containing protein [Chitinophaga sancti]SFW83439.1 lycopene cyclase domain-containing protein [Chitinophaga sancti]